MLKKVLKISAGAIVLVLFGLHFLTWSMSYSDNNILDKLGGKANIEYIEGVRVVSVLDSFQAAKPLIAFVHGAPGSFDAFNEYLNSNVLRSKTNLLSIDRPGYGESSPEALPSIEAQSNVLNNILEKYRDRPIILVGHSYGGPIVAKSAILNGHNIAHVMMIAPVISPEHEKFWWFSYLSYWKSTRWLFPNSFQTAGVEKFAHPIELGKLDKDWKHIKFPITHIHGEDDNLAPSYYNIEYSKKSLPDSLTTRLFYPDKGHLILWTDQDLIINQLLRIVDRIDSN